MKLNPRPEAFIFDMDGTLLDTEPLYTEAGQKVLDPFDAIFTMELKRKTMGGDSRRSAQIVIDHFGLPLTPEEFLSSREAHLLELFPTAPEMPGASEFVRKLCDGPIPLAVATSSHQHLYDIKLSHRDWHTCFKEVICGNHPELKHGKPAPDIFLLAARELGVNPEACIAFEDSGNGVQAALAAGMQVIAINSPYVEPGTLDGAMLVIDHYDELADMVSTWLEV